MTTLKAKDLETLLDCSKSTAIKKFRIMADSLGKKDYQPVTVEDAAGYLDLTPEFIREKLKTVKTTKK